jgi:gluconolactonase
MRLIIMSLAMSLGCVSLFAEELPKPTGETIVAPDAELELLFIRSAPISGGLTEGPAVAPDGSIYFTDIPFGKDNGMILRFDPKTKQTTVFTDDSGKANGLIFDRKGRLLACEGAGDGGRRISRWDVKTKERETIVDSIDGKRFNSPNDLCVDRKGNIYFTDPRYVGHEPRELEHRAIYRINKKGEVAEFTHNISKPNGIAISPDGDALYVADHDNGTDNIDPNAPAPTPGDMKIYAFRIMKKDGTVRGRRKTVVDFAGKKGCDGMTVDDQGNIYVTVRDPGRPGVLVVNPDGKEVAFIPTGQPNQSAESPVGLPSNVEFGIGEEISTLYVTVDTSLYRVQLKSKGFHVQYAARGSKNKKNTKKPAAE